MRDLRCGIGTCPFKVPERGLLENHYVRVHHDDVRTARMRSYAALTQVNDEARNLVRDAPLASRPLAVVGGASAMEEPQMREVAPSVIEPHVYVGAGTVCGECQHPKEHGLHHRRRCSRCHQPGHRADRCTAPVTEAARAKHGPTVKERIAEAEEMVAAATTGASALATGTVDVEGVLVPVEKVLDVLAREAEARRTRLEAAEAAFLDAEKAYIAAREAVSSLELMTKRLAPILGVPT